MKRLLLALLSVGLASARVQAEPMFLARQYARCTTCHYSPTGGGLLTPYGRMLSRQELSSTGATASGEPKGREHEFLFGLLEDRLGELSAGVDLRHARLHVESGSYQSTRDFLMNADLTLAWRHGPWTAYGEFGRQPRTPDTQVESFEHWLSYKFESGLGIRAGRFLPAYGVKYPDHSMFNRAGLDLDNNDQVYGVELSHTTDRRLLQLSIGPGRAQAVVDGDSGLTLTGRAQFDVKPRNVLVVSGMFRASTDHDSRNGSLGLAYGLAPSSRVTLWAQGDTLFREAAGGNAWVFTGEASFEAHRGLWLKLMPQLRTAYGEFSGGTARLGVGVDLLPRSHWNVIVNYYHDRARGSEVTANTWMAQLHLYL